MASRLLWVLILELALGFPVAQATKLPIIEEALHGDLTPGAAAQRPEPALLKPEWWQFFDVKGEELQRRVQSMLERLDALLGELPRETAEAARAQVELIRANLQALLPARAQPSPEPPTPTAYRESYTLPQLLAIAERLRVTRIELQADQDDIVGTDRTVRAANGRIDTLLAAYLGLAPIDPDRISRGLEIMAERSALAVTEENLRVRKARAQSNQVIIQRLTDEQAVAARRLVADRGDRTALNAGIDQAREALAQAQERFTNEQSRALGVIGDSAEDRATARYRQQRVTRAGALEAVAAVGLLKQEAQKDLVALLLDTDVDTSKSRNHLVGWNAQLANIRRQASTWAETSMRERQRAGESLADRAGSGEVEETQLVTSVKLINEDRLRLAQETLVALQGLEDDVNQALFIVQLVDEQLAHREGGLRDWVIWLESALKSAWDRTTTWIGTSLFKIGGAPVTALGLLRVALIVTIAWWISYWLRHALRRLGERREGANLPAFYTVGRLSHYTIVVIGFLVGLSSIGIDFTNFALVAGAIAIGIGFGLQSMVNNFVSGLILLFERSLKVGDWVELGIGGTAGEVREINVRSTLINTNDNIDIVVPNSEFMNGKVTNWTLLEGYCRIHLPFRVAYGTDKELVRQAGLEAAEKVPHTLYGIPGKNPGVWLIRFGDSGLEFELVVWITPRAVKRPGAVRAAYMWEIDSALRKYGIEIPFPQRELHWRGGYREILQNEPNFPLENELSAHVQKNVKDMARTNPEHKPAA